MSSCFVRYPPAASCELPATGSVAAMSDGFLIRTDAAILCTIVSYQVSAPAGFNGHQNGRSPIGGKIRSHSAMSVRFTCFRG